MRRWRTVTATGGGVNNLISTTSYKTYTLKEVSGIIGQLRVGEKKPGEPARKLKPVSRYVLAESLRQYFKKHAKTGAILESITVEDTKPNAT